MLVQKLRVEVVHWARAPETISKPIAIIVQHFASLSGFARVASGTATASRKRDEAAPDAAEVNEGIGCNKSLFPFAIRPIKI